MFACGGSRVQTLTASFANCRTNRTGHWQGAALSWYYGLREGLRVTLDVK